jgi:ABC-type nitrate/sulfonate/bicarbonate transport system substrate-binding protein
MMRKMLQATALLGVLAGLALAAAGPVRAADKVRLVISTKMPFELYAPELAQKLGYYKDAGLDVSIIYGSGGADTLQAIITGSADIATGNGSLGIIAAFAKGAPITVIANSGRGTGEVYWYAPVSSPVHSLKDLDGKALVYSRPGSTTDLIAQVLAKSVPNVHMKLVSVGGMSASRTMVMSGQVATGWAAFPANYELVRTGKARVIAKGDEAESLQKDSIRFDVANTDWLKSHHEIAARFMQATAKGQDALYTPAGIKSYAERWNIDIEDAKRAPEFTPKSAVTFAPIGNLDGLIETALRLKMIKQPLTDAQKKQMIDIVWSREQKKAM